MAINGIVPTVASPMGLTLREDLGTIGDTVVSKGTFE